MIIVVSACVCSSVTVYSDIVSKLRIYGSNYSVIQNLERWTTLIMQTRKNALSLTLNILEVYRCGVSNDNVAKLTSKARPRLAMAKPYSFHLSRHWKRL